VKSTALDLLEPFWCRRHARHAAPAARVLVERRPFHSETFGDAFQSLALNGTKVSKKFAMPGPRQKSGHKTVYRFRQSVSLGAHGSMVRPRDSLDLRLMSHTFPRISACAAAAYH
jgi:hypothetical protein